MNIETTRMAMIKRAADMAGLAKSVAQTANPIRNINAANAGYAIGKTLAPAPASNAQAAAPAPTAPVAPAASANPAPVQAKGPLQRILEAGRAAYQIGQATGQKNLEWAKAHPDRPWATPTSEHVGDNWTHNIRNLADAFDQGVRNGEEATKELEPQAKAIDQAIGEIKRDPRSTIQDVQNAEQNGVFSKGLNNLILYLRNRKAPAPAVTAPAATGSTEIAQ